MSDTTTGIDPTTGTYATTNPLDQAPPGILDKPLPGAPDEAPPEVLNEEAVAHVALAMQQAHHGPESIVPAGEYLNLARSILAAMAAIPHGPPMTVPAEPEPVPLPTEQAAA